MIATKASKYALPSMSYKARSLNIETFVISKLIHRLRHLCQRRTLIKKLNQDLIKKHIESGKKRRLKKSERNLSIEQGGQLLELTKDTKTKDVYDFLRNLSNQMKAKERPQEGSEKLQINTDNLNNFVK